MFSPRGGGSAPNGRECVHPMDAITCTQWTRSRPPNARDRVHPMHAIVSTQCTKPHAPNGRNRTLPGLQTKPPRPRRERSLSGVCSVRGSRNLCAGRRDSPCEEMRLSMRGDAPPRPPSRTLSILFTIALRHYLAWGHSVSRRGVIKVVSEVIKGVSRSDQGSISALPMLTS